MEIRQLISFRMLARNLSFSRTAENLGYVQSAVSAQIKSLEVELGVLLFERTGNQIMLTDAGERFLGYVDQILHLIEAARASVNQEAALSGSLVITAPESFCTYHLPALLHVFRERYPNTQLSFRQSADTIPIEQILAQGEADAAFVIEEAFENPSLVIKRIKPEPLALVAYPGHDFALTRWIKLADLSDETLLMTGEESSLRRRFARELRDVRLTSLMTFQSVEAIKQCVKTGLGLGVVPHISVQAEIEQNKLVLLRWENSDKLQLTIYLVWHKNKWVSPLLQAFIETVRDVTHSATSL